MTICRHPLAHIRVRGLVVLLPGLLIACGTRTPVRVPDTYPKPEARVERSVTQPETLNAQLSSLLAYQERVYRVAAPLLVKNAPLCRSQARGLLGFTAKNLYSYPSELSSAVAEQLRLGERLQVMQVLPGSGAMRAGIQRGDILQSVQNQPLPEGPQAENAAARLIAPLLKDTDAVTVAVLRGDKPLTLSVPLTAACAFVLEIGQAPHVNAYADGRRILLTHGMLDLLQTDGELAVVLAREMAHNVFQHARQLHTAASTAEVIDRLLPLSPDLSAFAGSAGLKPATPAMDQEADRLALYLLARAGYDPGIAEPLLTRLAAPAMSSSPNTYAALHPWTEERQQRLRVTLTEIRQKQASKKALVP